MAQGGGGAWKVAYADFVTAMMAFFLVMWICGQDQKVRQAVSFYFNDPANSSMVGSSKHSTRSGSVSSLNNYGNVPQSESVALGRGRQSHSRVREKTPATKLVGDWLHAEPKANKAWAEQAEQARGWAAGTKEVREKLCTRDEAAAVRLANLLRDDLGYDIATSAKGLQQELLFEILGQVNWLELAEDLLGR